MEKVFELIFSQISEQIEKQLNADTNQQDGNEQELSISGTVPFNIQIDGQGNASREITKKGFGFTIYASAIIDEPGNGTFDIEVTSSGGGSFAEKGVRAGTPIKGTLKTEGGLCNTTVRGKIHSSIPNIIVKGKLSYHT